jgi:hypothetical protein
MKITAKIWTIIGVVISILGLGATLLPIPSEGDKTNSDTQSVKGINNIQIQGRSNNVNKN